jgi:thymidylate synthase (FAD)
MKTLEEVSSSNEIVELVSITPDAEKTIVYCARVSNPSGQNNFNTAPKLIKFLIANKHWSPFEMAHLTVQIKTSRGIAPQILRHRSFTFQEFSQRYAAVDEKTGLHIYAARRQDKKNRQNSIDDLSQEVKDEWERRQLENWKQSFEHYKWALDNEIAKECARMVLPLGTATTMYMSGSIRSWIHYVEIRADVATQKEHRDIALAVKKVFCKQLPNIAKALGWITEASAS